jgi:nitrogen regulatory protein PII
MDVTPRVLIVAVVDDDQLEAVIQLIQNHGQTDHPNDGWIVVSPVDDVLPVDVRELEPQ